MSRAESPFLDSASASERPAVVRKHRSELRHTRASATRDDSSAGFVVEWQLIPIDETDADADDVPVVRLTELGA